MISTGVFEIGRDFHFYVPPCRVGCVAPFWCSCRLLFYSGSVVRAIRIHQLSSSYSCGRTPMPPA